MQFMFPSNPTNSRQVDPYFVPQANSLPFFGNPKAVFSLEEDWVHGVIQGETILYRGWMLTSAEYHHMAELVEAAGGTLLTSVTQYLNGHHLPNWYPFITGLTAETVIIDNNRLTQGIDIVSTLKQLGWERFFLKDFVKSLKTAGGSVVNTPEDAPKVMELMKQYRGMIEGGLCIRKYEELHDEQRYFIVNKHVAASDTGLKFPADTERLLQIFDIIIDRIDSSFLSVDIAYNESNQARVVEIGDGQVSDLVGWELDSFSKIFNDLGVVS